MQLSCQLPPAGPSRDALAYASLADELGYASINCSHIAGRDSFTTLAAAAVLTRQAVLATAVAPIYHRSPASMAQTAATLHELSGGRFRLGLGVGHRVTMAGWHGQEIGDPVAEMREYLGVVRAILAGRTPPAGRRWNSTFSFSGVEPPGGLPVFLAALSPTMLRLAGEICDGVLLWACPPDYVRDVVVPEVARGRESAGRTIDGFAIVPAIPAAVVTDPGTALNGIRDELHRYFGLPFYRKMFKRAGFARDLAAYDDAGDREAQKKALPEELIFSLCAIGDSGSLRDAMNRYSLAGATDAILTNIRGTDFEPALRAGGEIIGQLRPASSRT